MGQRFLSSSSFFSFFLFSLDGRKGYEENGAKTNVRIDAKIGGNAPISQKLM